MGSNSPLKKPHVGMAVVLPPQETRQKQGWQYNCHPNNLVWATFPTAAKLGLACIVCAVVIGCGRGKLERVVVSGRVTYQGQPVTKGKIRFIPIKDTKTPMWGAFIHNGRYEAGGKGGVPVGTHRVEIVAWRTESDVAETTNPPTPDRSLGGAPMGQQYVPEKYNAKTELEITIPPGSGKVVRDFDL